MSGKIVKSNEIRSYFSWLRFFYILWITLEDAIKTNFLSYGIIILGFSIILFPYNVTIFINLKFLKLNNCNSLSNYYVITYIYILIAHLSRILIFFD